jgi:hypothetical protein
MCFSKSRRVWLVDEELTEAAVQANRGQQLLNLEGMPAGKVSLAAPVQCAGSSIFIAESVRNLLNILCRPKAWY